MSKILQTRALVILLQLSFSFITVISDEEKILSGLCRSQVTSCSDCLNFHPNCSWCYDLDFIFVRCDLSNKLTDFKCSSIHKGRKSTMAIKANSEFRDVTDMVKNAVQIRPQRVKVQLRPGTKKTIKLKYQIAKNYPLDLYYLMDATYTMKDDLETVATLGDHLTHSLSNLTKHFRIGFGTFSDKVVMPFARMDQFENPCTNTNEKFCSPSYGFKHQYELNMDVKGFIEKVNNTKVTANLDNAEGALDALMQVLVCGEKVGWRNDSRKLILLLTNGLLHFAGDGKLAGITKIADGLCHLDSTGFYDKAEIQDYPSLEQIYRKLKKHKTNVILAVTESVYDYYKKLETLIPNYSFVTKLHSDSSNILNVIKKGYEEAVSVVEFQDNAQLPIEITYFSTCNKQFFKLNQTSSCYGVKEGEKYEFDVNIQLQSCPDDPKLWNQTVLIDETHLETESLVIDVEMLCGCDCTEIKKNYSMCNYHGDIVCGMCKCKTGWSGQYCDCDLSNFENNQSLENSCREITENTISIMCHGNGECICGKCECDSLFTDKYCQCPRCKRINGQECGGPAHGLCSCGMCLCMPGYTGPDCLCSLEKSTCIAPGDKEECNGHGYCKCGKCECDTEPLFSGKYCEKCSTCSGLCHLYDECAKCTILNNCKSNECKGNSVIINSIEFVDSFVDETNKCLVLVNKEFCPYWHFVYNIKRDNTVQLQILNVSCRPPVGAMYYAGGAFLLVVLLGILIITAVIMRGKREDKRRYAKYLEDLAKSRYEENPIFKDPIIRSQMPRDIKFE